MHTKKSGFIFILTLSILSILTVLITSIYNRVVLYAPYASALKKREQAKMLALGGIEIAIAQIEQIINPPEEKKTKEKEDKKQKNRLVDLVEILNSWQDINLDDLTEIKNPSLSVYISSQQGKINLSSVYDTEKKLFKIDQTTGVDYGKMLLELGELGKKLVKDLPNFLTKRSYEPQDLTEFLTLSAFKEFEHKLWIKKEETGPFFMDLFSLSSGKKTINPLCASVSLQEILGFSLPTKTDKESKEKLSKIIENLGTTGSVEKAWNQGLDKIYQKEWKDIPEQIKKLFTLEYEPFLFSVVSYARVDSVTQKIYALVKQESHDKIKRFVIERIYWI